MLCAIWFSGRPTNYYLAIRRALRSHISRRSHRIIRPITLMCNYFRGRFRHVANIISDANRNCLSFWIANGSGNRRICTGRPKFTAIYASLILYNLVSQTKTWRRINQRCAFEANIVRFGSEMRLGDVINFFFLGKIKRFQC